MLTAATEYVNTSPEQALVFPLMLPGVLGVETLNESDFCELLAHADLARTLILPALQEEPNNT